MTEAYVEAHQRALDLGRSRCIEASIVETEPLLRGRRLLEMVRTAPSCFTVARVDLE